VALRIAQATEAFGRFDRLSLVARRTAHGGLGGEHRSRRRAASTDFVDHRPYQPGDDFRRVDWNVYGRLGSLQVKLTESREQLDLVLVLDCSASMAYGAADKLTFAAQLVATLGYVGLARSDSVRIVCLRAGGEPLRLGPLRDRRRLPELVRFLTELQPGGSVDLESVLPTCVPREARQPLVIIVSDLLAATGIEPALDALAAQRVDTVVLHVLSQEEADPTMSGDVELIDAETGEVLELGANPATLELYRERYAAWLNDQESLCTSRGVRYSQIRSDREVPSVVLDDLRRAQVVR
jgi:uncharacterized protein (DUF58 family)